MQDSDLFALMDMLEKKIRQQQQYQARLEKTISRMDEENTRLRQVIEEQQEQLNSAHHQQVAQNVAGILEADDEYKGALKQAIDQYIVKIDEAILYLNSQL
jgi:regulator of replication initiation timing